MAAATKTQAASKVTPLPTAIEITDYLVPAKTVFDQAVSAGLPLRWDAEVGFAVARVMSDERLRKCQRDSLVYAVQQIANVGLSLNPIKGHCTIIARWSEAEACFLASFMPMYRGLVYLATQAGCSSVVADVVYKADKFSVRRTSEGDFFEHDIAVTIQRDTVENPCMGGYCAARMPNGERKVEWVPIDDLVKMRAQSDSYLGKDGNPNPNSPWVKWFDEQCKKSAIKRASKHWEEMMQSDERWGAFRTAVDLDHKAGGGGITIEHATQEEAKITIEQVAEIEAKAAEIGLNDVNRYLSKVCAAYNVTALSELPESKMDEVLDRIATATKEAKAVKAKAKTAAKK